MTKKEKSSIIEFLEKKLKDAENKCGENSKEVAFINAAKDAVGSEETRSDNLKNFSYHLCPDQYVGNIGEFKNENGKAKKDFPVRLNIFAGQTADVCIKFSSYEKIMIFIPESPHQKEFYTKDEINENGTKHLKGDPKGPTQGPTGINIRTHIAKIFPDYQDYHLIVMNAIPFQCSLGFKLTNSQENQNRRDDIFKKVWNKKNIGVKFFKDRLKNLLDALLKKDIVIVNACTTGDQKDPLYCRVCHGIADVVKNYYDEQNEKKYAVKFYRTYHPAHWIKSNDRKILETIIVNNY